MFNDLTDNKSRGVLVAIGGAEDKTSEAVILRRVLGLAPDPSACEVGVIATASGYPDETFATYDETFGRLGAKAVHNLDVRTRADAGRPELIEAIERCNVIFLTGGDQLRLTHILGGSPLLAAIRQRREQGAVIAGTSAGAAAMSATMIYNGHAADALRKGAVKMSSGLAFVHGVIIDSHFLERGRFTRLMEVGTTNPEYLGIGIGEDAGVIIHEGPILEAIGNGHVIIVDSSELRVSNVFELSDGEPVAVEHVIMHALTSGFGYDVRKRRFLSPSDLENN
ncbi:cyanophycinase [Acuticoccus sp. MNP-M23]|uniref:cyanophycinase n=1 Tax=Acuticoccus sp. MNP-M23 TaxID=3072793 RepID=UPI002814BE0F|nr:cyanophycinase [Acuticoccus sp. MNP-M23]WMS41864.1 cyanophycinase [Acuticoccus sp. MNP-M23]